MGTLYITEYARAARDNLQNTLPCGEEPGATYCVEISSKSAASEPFAKSTRFVRLMADEPCHIVFSDDPVARVWSMPLAPYHPEIFGVSPGLRLAVIAAD